MKQTLRSLSLILLAIVGCSMRTNAATFNVTFEGINYSIDDETLKATVVSGSDYSGTIIIPEYVVDGDIEFEVIAVGERAFSYSSDVTHVSLPPTVKTIGDYAFTSCYGLESIELPAALESMGEGVFNYCTALKGIELPATLKVLNSNTFYSCRALEEITLPASIIMLGEGCFTYCSSIRAYNVDENNPAFSSENGVLFTKDKKVLVAYPAGKDATEYEVPAGVEALAAYAFQQAKVQVITLPEGLKSIGAFALSETPLKELTLPASLANIGASAFYNCEQMSVITVDESNVSFATVDGVLYDYDKTELIYIPTLNTFENVTLPAGVKKIDESAAYNCVNLKSVVMKDEVEEMGNYAFAGCTGLESIRLSHSLKTIPMCAFLNCSSLEVLDLPNSLESLGNYALAGCASLETIVVPSSVTKMEGGIFSGCSSLQEADIQAHITTVPSGLFYGCTSLMQVIFPGWITAFANNVFGGCNNMEAIFLYAKVPPTVTYNPAVGIDQGKCILYVPIESVSDYNEDPYWTNFLNIEGIDISGIQTVKDSRNSSEIFSLDGRRQPQMQRGINIIRTAGGQTRKVLVK